MWRVHELPQRVREVLSQLAHPIAEPQVSLAPRRGRSQPLARVVERGRTESAKRLGARIVGRQAVRDEIVDPGLEKRRELFVGLGASPRVVAERQPNEPPNTIANETTRAGHGAA